MSYDKEYQKRYYREHIERITARNVAWTKNNPVRVRENARLKAARWRKANPEKYKEQNKKNRDRTRLRCAAWRRQHPEKHCSTQALRRARKRAVTIGDLTDIAKVYERARWWRQWFDVVVDHVIPLSKGGTHQAVNLQVIYGHENAVKRDRIDYEPKVIFGGIQAY